MSDTATVKVDWDELEYEGNGYTYDGAYFTGIAFETTSAGYTEQSFVKGVEHGKLRVWNLEKVLIEEAEMEFGSLHGTRKLWYADGQPRLELRAERGIVVREQNWDESGALTKDFTMTEDHPRYKTLQIRKNTKYPDWSELLPEG